MQRWIIGLIILGLLIAGGLLLQKDRSSDSNSKTAETASSSPTTTLSVTTAPLIDFTFDFPKKSAHYVSNTPAHAEILTSSPEEAAIHFNFDLASNSMISVMKDKIEYGTGDTQVSADLRSLTRPVQADLPNGVYTVLYTACWPDGSCHDGQFEFGTNRP